MDKLEDILGKKIIDKKVLEVIEEKIKYHIENPPNLLCVNVVLNDASALKHLICREIIMIGSGVTEQEADWYILRSGSERELEKLASIGLIKKQKDEV